MTTLTDSHSRRVLFHEGEGADPDDPTQMQLYAQAQLMENLLASGGARVLDNPVSPLANRGDGEGGDIWNAGTIVQSTDVFCPYPGAGYIRATTNANELVTIAGPIMQLIGTAFDGSGESVAMFRLPSGTTLTTAVGDVTFARIDLVEIKLEYVDADPTDRDFMDAITGAITTESFNKTRRVQATIQINQGTPAASPAYPTPTAGFAALAAVYVPAFHNAVHDPADLRDQRFPLGNVQVIDTPANAFYRPGSPAWTLNQEQYCADSNDGAVASVYAYPSIAGKNARLLGVAVYGRWGDGIGTNVELVRTTYQAFGSTAHTVLAAPSTTLLNGTSALRTIATLQISDQIAAGSAHKGLRVPNRRVGVPMWASGWPAGVAKPETASDPTTSTKIGLKITSQSTTDVGIVNFVRWFFTTGL